MKKLLSILFMMVSVHVFAQDNVISAINITLPTNPDANTANWGTGKSLFVISATGQMVGGRVNPLLEEGRILVIIKQGGNKVCGAYTSKSAPAADFNTITKVWSGSNAASLLGKDCTLPAGDYELSVQFFGSGAAGTIPLSEEKTKPFTIRGNDQQAYQPPQLIYPLDGTTNSEADIKKPITFRWAPVIPKPQDPVTYRLSVWQLMQGQTGPQAIKVNQPIIIKDVDNLTQAVITNIVDGPCKPPLRCDFVWNVQALNRDGKSIGANNGTSETFSFSYASASCGSILADSTIKCNGTDPKTGLPVYAITITLKNLPTNGSSGCNAKFNNVTINSGGGNISASSSLPITIAPNGSATISFNYTPGTPGATSASVILFGNWTDALGNSTNLQVNFGLPKCISCGCSRQWNPLKVQMPGGFKDYDCGSTIVWQCKTPFVFTSSYDCTGSNGKPCDAKISWTVSQSGGGIIQSGNSATGIFTPNANGAYTVTLNAECNGQKCAPCSYTIVVRDCIDCGCNKQWNPLKVLTATRPLFYDCGSTIPWKCKNPFSFAGSYQCISSSGKPCDAIINWSVSQSGAGVIQSGNTATGSFTPTANGTYTLTLDAECNGQKCKGCSYTITVNDCVDCGCNRQWNPIKVQNAAGFKYYDCGSTIPWNCKNPFSFISSYSCTSTSGKPCDAVINWSVSQAGGGIIQTGNTATGTFTPIANGAYTVTLNAECNGQKCAPCTYTIIVRDCINCDCGKWGQLTIHTLTRPLIYNCGNTIPWNCNKPFDFTSVYECSGSNGRPCTADINWGVSLNGSVIQSGNGASGSFTPTANGSYTLTLNVECGGKKCPPCTYTIVVADCCSCGGWGSLNVPRVGGLVMEYRCGSSIAIPMSCNQPFNFTSAYQCSPADKGCQAVTSWEVTEGTTVLKTGTGTSSIAGSFTPAENGTYTITLYASCGGVKCPACSYKAVVANCCSCGTWPPVEVNGKKYECGSTIQWSLNQSFSFTTTYQCSADNKNCQPSSFWEITKDGASVATGSGAGNLSGAFTPATSGNYTLTLNASCNEKRCPPCVIYIQVPDPCPTLCNGDFEQILNGLAPATFVQTNQANIPCWKTMAPDHQIEIWHTGFNGVTAYSGTYFAEINATMVGALYQTFTINTPKILTVSFAHRGRYPGPDVMKVSIIRPDGSVILLGTYSDNYSGWMYRTTTAQTLTPPGTYTLKFESVSSNGGKGPDDGGNFLDDVSISCTDGSRNR